MCKNARAQAENTLLIGTYTQSGSKGIYVARFNEVSGKLTIADSVEGNNPSYLCLSPDGKRVYAIDEIAGNNGGDVSSYTFNKETAALKLINKQSSGGDHPCFIDMHRRGKWVAAANYSGGCVSFLPVANSGGLNLAAQTIQYSGSGPNKQRQEKPHVHQSLFSHGGKYVWVTDLGLDQVTRYRFYSSKKQPVKEQEGLTIKLKPGAGPRHIAVHLKQSNVYVLEELSGAVSVIHYSKHGAEIKQTIQADSVSVKPGSADIHLSPDGKFLYASNRANANTITIFKVDGTSGLLEKIGIQSTLGQGPRNFVIHPSGLWLLVANQQTNNVVVFKRDIQSGMLSSVNQSLPLPTPVCLVFAY